MTLKLLVPAPADAPITYRLADDGRFLEINHTKGTARVLGANKDHPLASQDGITLLCMWLHYGQLAAALTKAQARCLTGGFVTPRPWARLVELGYADADGLTTAGRTLATFILKVRDR